MVTSYKGYRIMSEALIYLELALVTAGYKVFVTKVTGSCLKSCAV